MARLLIALSDTDCDATEVAVPWHVFDAAGHEIVFATTTGAPPAIDPLTLTGVLFGQLGATRENQARFHRMAETEGWKQPLCFADVSADDYDALHLPGGHAKGMRPYLESEALFALLRDFLAADKPVGSICHGGLVLARAKDPETGHSVIRGRTLTALPFFMEWLAWAITAWKLGDYYRTYPEWVQDEMKEALGPEGTFRTGPWIPSGFFPFTVVDGNLVTARWPGDAQRFAETLLEAVEKAT